ncbi:MAG: hypothetical protein GX800_13545, partial [Clostridiaceae bacterium]|nr:hypothetical protein [Clostridiaceae bacterium]
MMKSLFEKIMTGLDREWLETHIRALLDKEAQQTFTAYSKASEYTYQLLKECGFKARILRFPADGKTVYQDKCTPIAWDISHARLTLLTSCIGVDSPVIADYKTEPLSVVKHSTSTPPEGICTRIITEEQMLAGEECTNAIVLLAPDTRPRGEILTTLLDLGAIGFVSDYTEDKLRVTDHVQWTNACCEKNGWHFTEGEREFIGFNVSPEIGRAVRTAINTEEVKVLVESDGRRYEGHIDAVTALIPGRQKKEFWILSHLYEPFIDDNSAGVIGSIEAVREILSLIHSGDLPQLEFSIRSVFASELYGFAAVADYFGVPLNDRVMGAINTDGLVVTKDKSKQKKFEVRYAPPCIPFFGNSVLKTVIEEFMDVFPDYSIIEHDNLKYYYGDDCFMSDPTIGVPTMWLMHPSDGLHHNSKQNEQDMFDLDALLIHLTLITGFLGKLLTIREESLAAIIKQSGGHAQKTLDSESKKSAIRPGTCYRERMEYLMEIEKKRIRSFSQVSEIPGIESILNSIYIPNIDLNAGEPSSATWFDYASGIIIKRITPGFPHDLMRIPYNERTPLPGNIFSNVLSHCNGLNTLQTAIKRAEWETNTILSEKEIKGYIFFLLKLAEAGYLYMTNKNIITRKHIVKALQDVGIVSGDLLLFHSSKSAIGCIEGGDDTVIDALLEVVGEYGTILMPAFTRPYIAFDGRINKSRNFRPFNPLDLKNTENITTGSIPKTLLSHPGAVRSRHSTHSWVGIGLRAEECISKHELFDPPASKDSP